MNLLFAVIAALSTGLLGLVAFWFSPMTGEFLSSASVAGVPFWIGVTALTLGQFATTLHLIRAALSRRT